MKYFKYILIVCLFVAIFDNAAQAAVTPPPEPTPPKIFRDAFNGDDRAFQLDKAYMVFNNRVSALLDPYYYERRKIFDFLHPAFIYKHKNLTRSYEAYKAAVIKRDEVYEQAKALFKDGDKYLEANIIEFGGEEEEKARDLWQRLKKETAGRVHEFFTLENKFLNGYKKQVIFLQSKAGRYYFLNQTINFQTPSDAQYHSQISVALKKISNKQFKILLKQNIAAR